MRTNIHICSLGLLTVGRKYHIRTIQNSRMRGVLPSRPFTPCCNNAILKRVWMLLNTNKLNKILSGDHPIRDLTLGDGNWDDYRNVSFSWPLDAADGEFSCRETLKSYTNKWTSVSIYIPGILRDKEIFHIAYIWDCSQNCGMYSHPPALAMHSKSILASFRVLSLQGHRDFLVHCSW
jgi:hypothetical protein